MNYQFIIDYSPCNQKLPTRYFGLPISSVGRFSSQFCKNLLLQGMKIFLPFLSKFKYSIFPKANGSSGLLEAMQYKKKINRLSRLCFTLRHPTQGMFSLFFSYIFHFIFFTGKKKICPPCSMFLAGVVCLPLTFSWTYSFFSSFIYLFLDFCSFALQCQTQSTCVFLASLCAVGPHIRPGKEGP